MAHHIASRSDDNLQIKLIKKIPSLQTPDIIFKPEAHLHLSVIKIVNEDS
jgi:hypothetical protein